MRVNDVQLGKPSVLYKDVKANIESLSGLAEGSHAYAVDTDELGTYTGNAWQWQKLGNGVCNEVPSGEINGTNTAFQLQRAPAVGRLRLYQNGLRLREGVNYDYVLSGNTITMNTPPLPGDWLMADYEY